MLIKTSLGQLVNNNLTTYVNRIEVFEDLIA